ncbi:SEC-C metal-binding domain-containing protein [Azotobacter beijerinckii]
MTTHPAQAHNLGCPCGSGRRLDECCGR